MANHVGVDLSNQGLRVLETEGTAKKLKLKRFGRIDLIKPGEAPASSFLDKEMSKPIDGLFSAKKISREPTALSWDSDSTIFRELEEPFTGVEQIRKVIKSDLEPHLLNLDIDDVIVSFYKLSEDKDKSRVMVMAVRKDLLANRFDVLNRAGVDPLVADLDVMAAFNALSGLGYTKEHKSFMLLDCGRRTTNLLLISEERLVAGRAIRMGSDQLMKRIADDLETDSSSVVEQSQRLLARPENQRSDDLIVTSRAAKGGEPEETKKLPVELARDLALQRAGDFFQRITREVRRTLATARVADEVEVVYVSGPGSRLPGFAEGIAASLGIEAPIKPLAWLERVDSALSDEDATEAEAEGLTALGLCFKLAGHDETGIDFRQEEVRYARKFDQVKEPLLYLAGLVLFFVLLLNLLDFRKLSVRTPLLFQADQSNIARIYKQASDAYKTALGKDAKLPDAYAKPSVRSMNYILGQLRVRVEQLKGELGRGGSIPELPSAFTMWKDVFDAVAAGMDSGKIRKLYLDNLTIQVRSDIRPSIELNGYVPDGSAFDDLKEALQSINAKNVTVEPGQTAPKNVDGKELTSFTKLRVVYPERQDAK